MQIYNKSGESVTLLWKTVTLCYAADSIFYSVCLSMQNEKYAYL